MMIDKFFKPDTNILRKKFYKLIARNKIFDTNGKLFEKEKKNMCMCVYIWLILWTRYRV